ncbi:hypothetical protein HDU67_005412 [Dinochytrium kinnereticum]|nr:hypothetical protein HDU67_005412 [Dinochytrium kinnereticum]
MTFSKRVPLRDTDAIHGSEKPIRLLTERLVLAMDNPMLLEAHDGAWDRRRRREERERLRALNASTEDEASASEREVNPNRKASKFPAPKRFVYRPRKTGIRISDPSLLYPIQPWKTIRAGLATLITLKGSSKPDPEARDNLAEGEENPTASSIHMTIPYGFQLVRQLVHSRPTVRSAMFVPAATSTELFVTLDTHYVHVWRGSAKVKKYPTIPMASTQVRKREGRPSSFESREEGLGAYGIDKLVFIEKYRLYVVFSTQLQLKLLDSHFNEISFVSCPKPILCLEYVDSHEEIIAGEVGSIRVWKVKREM